MFFEILDVLCNCSLRTILLVMLAPLTIICRLLADTFTAVSSYKMALLSSTLHIYVLANVTFIYKSVGCASYYYYFFIALNKVLVQSPKISQTSV